ncbi:MAG: SGNH/GDSL hydrolase family protein [Planctomycetota bacterium]
MPKRSAGMPSYAETCRRLRLQRHPAGVEHLHYLPGEPQLAGRENGTVDGVHPTDLGFYRMAEAYEPVLRRILAGTR